MLSVIRGLCEFTAVTTCVRAGVSVTAVELTPTSVFLVAGITDPKSGVYFVLCTPDKCTFKLDLVVHVLWHM